MTNLNPLEASTKSTIGDYFTNEIAKIIRAPEVFDLALITVAKVDHQKGYLMMEVLPQNTGEKVFGESKFQKWEFQKPYLLDIFQKVSQLLSINIAMTDLKPANTLFDTDTSRATIIDLGGTVKFKEEIA